MLLLSKHFNILEAAFAPLQERFNLYACDTYVPEGAPVYQPNLWNSALGEKRRENINCYSYALNIAECGWGLPGYLQSAKSPNLIWNADNIKVGLERDGLLSIDKEDLTDLDIHVVAAFSRKMMRNKELYDFHFFRRDDNGFWSHKNGNAEVLCRDFLGRRITDPENAFVNKVDFLGYWKVPEEGLDYYPDPEF